MKFHSGHPVVVGKLEPEWASGLTHDYFLEAALVVGQAGTMPTLHDAQEVARYGNWVTKPKKAIPASEAEEIELILRQIVPLADNDYRQNKELDDVQATKHKLSIRSGIGTATSISQILFRANLPGTPKELRKSNVHIDGLPKEDVLQYTVCQGAGTAFWEGDFRTNLLLPGSLSAGWLGRQVRRTLPTFVARDDEILRVQPATLHQAPASQYDPRHPRRFLRDTVSLYNVEETS